MSYSFKSSKYIGGSNKKRYWYIVNNKLKDLKHLFSKTIDKDLFNMLTTGTTNIDNKYMYLDRDKYSGKGRPKKSDYKESPTLFINSRGK